MQAFVRWKCKACAFAGNAGTKELCAKCGAERGSGGGDGGAKPGSSAGEGQGPSKRARLADARADFETRYRGCALPQPWLAAAKGSVIFRAFEAATGDSGKRPEAAQPASAPVAGFDFDGCLCTFARGAAAAVPTAANVHQSLVFEHTKAVLEALHRRGYRIVIFSNESLARFKNADPIRDALARKLTRIDVFLQHVGVPAEVYLATHNDKFRKPATADINKRGHDAGGTAMWDFMLTDPLKVRTDLAPTAPAAEGFYVGDAAGRPGDISDGDRRFAERLGLPFYTPEDFFLRDGAAARLTGVNPGAPPGGSSAQMFPPVPSDAAEIDARLGAVVRQLDRPVLLVLSGLPGSGKSTLALRLVRAAPLIERFSQDLLGSRDNVQHACRGAFERGAKLVVVDRTNLSADQRGVWVDLARSLDADPIAVQLRVHSLECVKRCQQRADHEGNFPTAREKILNIIDRLEKSADALSADEGFSAILVIDDEPAADIAAWRVANVLQDPESFGPTRAHSLASPVLAFASISTGNFRFDPKLAASILLRTVSRWAVDNKLAPRTLRLVEPADSPLLAALQDEEQDLAAQARDLEALEIVTGDITAQKGVAAIAVGCARRVRRPGENKANVAVHKFLRKEETRFGSFLEGQEVAAPAQPVVVALPHGHALREETGAAYLFFTLGPNMNPQQDECLAQDPIRAQELLERAYLETFVAFHAVVKNQQTGADSGDITRTFQFAPAYDPPVGPAPAPTMSWQMALQDYVQTPVAPAYAASIFYADYRYTVIYDAYAKARVHLLVLPRAGPTGLNVDKMAALQPAHLPALEDLANFAQQLADHAEKNFANGQRVRVGFHARPSLRHLHVHVISQDFDSPALKNKKHWNSFTHKDFFMPVSIVIDTLRSKGNSGLVALAQRAEAALNAPLVCHRCAAPSVSMPALKQHLLSCEAPLP